MSTSLLVPRPAPTLAAADIPLRAGTVTVVHGIGEPDVTDLLATLTAPGACPGRFTVVQRRAGLRRRSVTLPTLVAPEVPAGRFTTVAGHLRRAAAGRGRRVGGLGPADVLTRLGLEPYARQHLRSVPAAVRTLAEIGARITAGAAHRVVLDLRSADLDAVAVRRIMELVAEAATACTAVLIATDDLDWADTAADQVVLVADGAIVAQGHPTVIGDRRHGVSTVSWTGPDGLHEHRTRAPGAVVAELEAQFGAEVHGIAVLPPTLDDVLTDLVRAHRRR